MSLATLVGLCHRVGACVPGWTQGTGGNISWKTGRWLYVKGTGLRLDAVEIESGIARVEREELLAAWRRLPIDASAEEAYAQMLADANRPERPGAPRPSMEAIVHALLPAPFVVHLHSLAALLMAHEHALDPFRMHAWWQRRGLRVVFLPAVRPGLLLGRAVEASLDAEVLILANHGVCLGLARPEDLDAWRDAELAFCKDWRFEALATLLASPTMREDAHRDFDRPIPMRLYFPDTAVFHARLTKLLRASEHGNFRLDPGDRDMSEIWCAQQVLFAICPALAELPEAIATAVAGLPTEKLRLAVKAG